MNKVNCSVRPNRTVFSSSQIFGYKDKTAIPANKAGIHTPIKSVSVGNPSICVAFLLS